MRALLQHSLHVPQRRRIGSAAPLRQACPARRQQDPTRAAATSSCSPDGPHICVVGAGVVGLTSALRLQQEAGARVTVVAERFGGDTTTAGAAGVWQPYKVSDTPEALTNRRVLPAAGLLLLCAPVRCGGRPARLHCGAAVQRSPHTPPHAAIAPAALQMGRRHL